ncbi:MAG TPA: hypothetical protein VEI25_16800, partial [Paraburkholderia sp.]|nr:hypothetical protein [Paraburkholderia sp.]
LYARRCLALQDMALYVQAAAACERARAMQGPGDWALLVSEWLAWAQGDLVQALHWNALVVKADSHSVGPYQRRADFLLTLGMAAEARKVLEQARIETQDREAIDVSLARVAFYEGGADALRARLASSQLDESVHARTLIETAYLHLFLGEPSQAYELMSHAMQAPDYDAGRLNAPWFARWGASDQLILAACELETGRHDAAARHLREIAQLIGRLLHDGEERNGLYALRAEVLTLSGDSRGAMNALDQAVKLGWREAWWARHEPYFTALWQRDDFRALMAHVDAANARMRSDPGLNQ